MKGRIINFDNAATSFPKPLNVRRAVCSSLSYLGGSAGRGSHFLSEAASEAVYGVRKKTAFFFGAETENVVFCSSCTHALNIVINSIAVNGSHIVISSAEHNSVLRPLEARAAENITEFSTATLYDSDEKTLKSFSEQIRKNTAAVICTAAGNVTGQIPPIYKIAELCRNNSICFIVDCAQASGRIPVRIGSGINFICTSGHKGLYGIAGTGLLISDGRYRLKPLMTGGTGTGSMDPLPPVIMPDSFECGTLNTAGIVSVGAGIDFINSMSMKRILKYEDELCSIFCRAMKRNSRIIIHRSEGIRYAPIVSFSIKDADQSEFADYLSRHGFCLRSGYHCAPLAHRTLGTVNGTIRFSPSVFNTEDDVKKLCSAIENAL